MAARRRAIDLVLPHLRLLDGYEAVDPPEVLAERAGTPVSEIVKLDANENPYGPSSKVAEALASLGDAHLYPDPAQGAMRAAIGRFARWNSARLSLAARGHRPLARWNSARPARRAPASVRLRLTAHGLRPLAARCEGRCHGRAPRAAGRR